MGLIAELGVIVKPDTAWRLQMFKLAMREPLASLVAAWTRPIDELVFRCSRGRTTMTGVISGFPVIWLMTTGAKSGSTRRTPLLGIPTAAGNLAVFGTNFGKESTPGWVYNLRASPTADVEYRGKTVAVHARFMGPDEVESVWDTASASAPTFARYRAIISNRTVSIFELMPT